MDEKVRWTNLSTSEIIGALQEDHNVWISKHIAFGSVILDKGLKDCVQAGRKGWQAVHKEPGFAFAHRSGA